MKGVKLGYGILLSITIILAIINSAYHIFLLLTVVLFLPVFLLLYLLYCRQCLSVRLTGQRYLYNKGEKIPLSVGIINSGIFPITNIRISIQYKNRYLPYENNVVFFTSVLSGKTQHTDFSINSEHCGELHMKISAVVIFDPFSLFQKKMELGNNKYNTETSIIVLPDFNKEAVMQNLRLNFPNETEDAYSLNKSGDDPSQVFDIREYRQGDRQQQIHWKLSLKQEGLMVREFSLPICDHFTIFIDFNVNSLSEGVLSLVDNMLKAALSLSYYLEENRIHHSIVWFNSYHQNSDSININCEDDIYRAIQYLLSVPLYEGEPQGKQWYYNFSRKSLNNILFFQPHDIPNVLSSERSAV